MNEEEICKENVCNCLYDVLIKGKETDDCVINPLKQYIAIQGSPEDYAENEGEYDYTDDAERLVILSLDEKDTFQMGDYVYTKVLRLMYGYDGIFNTKTLEKFDMTIYLVKYKNAHYLDFGSYNIYHGGRFLSESQCPPTIDIIAEIYGKISHLNWELIKMLRHLTYTTKDFIQKLNDYPTLQYRWN